MILGLDISTSVTGFAIVDRDGSLLYDSFVDTRNKKKFPDIHAVAKAVEVELGRIKQDWEIAHVFIESSLEKMGRHRSSARTLFLLAKVNAVISFLCEEIFLLKPNHIGASSARKKIGIIIPPKSKNQKQLAHKFIAENEKKFAFTLTHKGNPSPTSFDRADAIVIAKAGAKSLKKS